MSKIEKKKTKAVEKIDDADFLLGSEEVKEEVKKEKVFIGFHPVTGEEVYE